MLHNLLGALTGLTLLTMGAGSIHADAGQSQLADGPQAVEAKSKHKNKNKKKKKKKKDCDEVEVSGSFTVVHSGPPTVTPVAPDLCIIEFEPSFVFVGDLEGSFASTFVIEHAGACDQPAPEYFSTDGVWTGSVLGAEGSFEYSFEGTINAEGIATGELVIVDDSGTGALEDIEGSLTLTGIAGVEGTYSGTLELD